MSEEKTSYLPAKKVRVWGKGQFTIPAEIRERLGIREGAILDVRQVGRAMVVIPETSKIKELAVAVQDGISREGIDLAQLLAELREGHHEYEQD